VTFAGDILPRLYHAISSCQPAFSRPIHNPGILMSSLQSLMA